MLNTAPDFFAGWLESNATTYLHTYKVTPLQKSKPSQKINWLRTFFAGQPKPANSTTYLDAPTYWPWKTTDYSYLRSYVQANSVTKSNWWVPVLQKVIGEKE